MIHIQYENWEYSRHGVFTVKTVSHLRCFHEICQADVTELQAYEYSKSEDYEKAVTTNQKPDLRNADVRHKTCYRNLTAAQNVGAQGPGGLDLRILRVSRQIYVEANPVLWGTTTWSFRRNDHFRRWAEARNAFQRRLIKKVHLCDNRSFLRVIPKSVIMLFKKTFDVVYLNIEDWNARSSLEGKFYRLLAFCSSGSLTEIRFLHPFCKEVHCDLLAFIFQFSSYHLGRKSRVSRKSSRASVICTREDGGKREEQTKGIAEW